MQIINKTINYLRYYIGIVPNFLKRKTNEKVIYVMSFRPLSKWHLCSLSSLFAPE